MHPLRLAGLGRTGDQDVACSARAVRVTISSQHESDLAERFLAATAVLHPRSTQIATRANGQPAFGVYVRDPWAPILHATGLLVLTLAGDRISAMTRSETSMLAYFGLPRTLPP
jgi:hypothetical protein